MAIEKLTITEITINSKSAAGVDFVTKKGKKFKQIIIKVNESKYASERLSDLIFDEEDQRFLWKLGYVVSIIVSRNGNYFNFSVPNKFDYLEERVEEIEEIIRSGKLPVAQKLEAPIMGLSDEDAREDDILNSIPF